MIVRQFVLVACAVLLTGCSSLPSSGPSDTRIVASAAASLKVPDKGTTLAYALVDIDQNVVNEVPDVVSGSLSKTFGFGSPVVRPATIRVGDVIQLMIGEAPEGVLFSSGDTTTDTQSNFQNFPAQTIGSDGLIKVPFVDEPIEAMGLTTIGLGNVIVDKLRGKAVDPQVIVTIAGRAESAVTILGDVSAPQRLAINESGDRVLDVIARAGGIKAPPYETFVQVTRNGTKGSIYFNRLVADSGENIALRPGDVVFVSSAKRVFTAFGSTGQTGEFDFGQKRLTFDRAVAKAGGLLDGRADPRQTFLYRLESRDTLLKLGVDISAFPPEQRVIPTIYRANFADPASFFYARAFPMRDGDVIYISNADSVEILKFLQLVNATFTTVDSGIAATTDTRDLLRSF